MPSSRCRAETSRSSFGAVPAWVNEPSPGEIHDPAPEYDPDPTLNLLTIAEAAQRLRLSARTLRRHIASRQLVVVRIGRCVRIDPLDLQQFLDSRRGRLSICHQLSRDYAQDKTGLK